MTRVLVVGAPRSGTTWVGSVLGATQGSVYLGEPDNHYRFPFALLARRQDTLGHYPVLEPDDSATGYEVLWRSAFAFPSNGVQSGYTWLERVRRSVALGLYDRTSRDEIWAVLKGERRSSSKLKAAEWLAVPERPEKASPNVVVKSVQASLSLEWITERFPIRVVVVLRSPLNVLSSWAQMGWLGRPGDDMLDLLEQRTQEELSARWAVPLPPPGESVIARGAWLIAALTCALADAATRNPSWVVLVHEELAEDAQSGFRSLAASLGLSWSTELDRMLDDMNRPGSGYEPFRVASDLGDAWRTRLSREQIDESRPVLERFPLDERLVSRVP